jgi:leucine-rich repeat transmembrane neuronal protein 1/2
MTVVLLVVRYKITVDRTSKDIQIPGDQRLDLTGNLYIGGLSTNMFKDVTISSVLKSRHGFMGCLASVGLNGQSVDLVSSASNRDSVLSSCTGNTISYVLSFIQPLFEHR